MALSMAQHVGAAGQVHAFEPTDRAFAKLRRNVGLNPGLADRITTQQAFLTADAANPAPDAVYASWRLDGAATDRHAVHGGDLETAADAVSTSVDAYCDAQALTRVDLIKIDVDGFEWDVLQGAAGTIARHRPVVLFECGNYLLTERNLGFEAFTRFFRDRDYRLRLAGTSEIPEPARLQRQIPDQHTVDIAALPA